MIGEFPQLIGDITKGKRRINPALSIRIGEALGIEESFFAVLQIYHDLAQEKKKQTQTNKPDLHLLRPVIFWDTRLDSIDWKKSRTSVISRVFERGNEQEIREIIRFYGKEEVQSSLAKMTDLSPVIRINIQKYFS